MTMRLYHSSTFVLIWAGQSFGQEDQEDDQEDQEDDPEDQEDGQEDTFCLSWSTSMVETNE